ncbi:uncharacterized protein LOC101846124 isoform X2 [Aplysia californica]|uniref:Uncharacterized protein LOC101846124 isoform X2 n=1 Tax=Aplysia californica TaxID=6500 RepID=A0ABM0ZWG0_APLCA|nr:uncharacterized protein LOC101846124 isoform X2 [Aplysia californica]
MPSENLLREYNAETGNAVELSAAVKNFKQSEALESVDGFDRDLMTLQDQILNLSVRTHMLEVDLATLFSPDLILELEKMDQSCVECTLDLEKMACEEFSSLNADAEPPVSQTDSLLPLDQPNEVNDEKSNNVQCMSDKSALDVDDADEDKVG